MWLPLLIGRDDLCSSCKIFFSVLAISLRIFWGTVAVLFLYIVLFCFHTKRNVYLPLVDVVVLFSMFIFNSFLQDVSTSHTKTLSLKNKNVPVVRWERSRCIYGNVPVKNCEHSHLYTETLTISHPLVYTENLLFILRLNFSKNGFPST